MSTKTTTLKPYENERKAAKDNTLANYNTQFADLDASKKRQQEMASITLDKLQKYLPYQLKAQGLSNTGASESTLIQAHNNYMNTMADISANYNAQKNELERYKLDDLAAIDEKYDAKMEAESLANLELFNSKVTEMLSNYEDENGKISSDEKNELLNYINSKSDMLTDTDKARLMTALDGYLAADETEQAAIDALQSRADTKADSVTLVGNKNTANGISGDNFKVSFGDTEYDVEKGLPASDKASDSITKAYGGTPNVGSSVVYEGKIYMYLEDSNGTKNWYTIQGRGNEESFRNLTKALNISEYDRTDVGALLGKLSIVAANQIGKNIQSNFEKQTAREIEIAKSVGNILPEILRDKKS